jgi:hypothetical protein
MFPSATKKYGKKPYNNKGAAFLRSSLASQPTTNSGEGTNTDRFLLKEGDITGYHSNTQLKINNTTS